MPPVRDGITGERIDAAYTSGRLKRLEVYAACCGG